MRPLYQRASRIAQRNELFNTQRLAPHAGCDSTLAERLHNRWLDVYKRQTGSGSVVFGLFEHAEQAAHAQKVLAAQWPVCLCAQSLLPGAAGSAL